MTPGRWAFALILFLHAATLTLAPASSSAGGPSGGDPDCPGKMARLKAQNRARELGNVPGPSHLAFDSEITRLADGSWVISAQDQPTDPIATTRFTPIDPLDLTKGYNVKTFVGNDPKPISENFSAGPPKTKETVRTRNQQLAAERAAHNRLLEKYRELFSLSEMSIVEGISKTLERNPQASADELAILAHQHAFIFHPDLAAHFRAGVAEMRPSRQEIIGRIEGKNPKADSDTVNNDVQWRFADIIGAFRALREAGFQQEVDPIWTALINEYIK